MQVTDKRVWIVAVVALVVAFAFGRYSAPEKVKTETKVVTVEKKVEDQTKKVDVDQDQHKETTETEVIRPDGTKEIVTKTTEDTKTDQDSSTKTDIKDTINQTASQTVEVTRGGSKLSVSLLVGAPLSLSSGLGAPVYGASVSRPLLGPITVGLWGLSNSTGGASVGLTF